LAQPRLQASLGHLALEQREVAAARHQVHRAGVVDIRHAGGQERNPWQGFVLQYRGNQVVDDRAALSLESLHPIRPHQHIADAGMRVRVNDQHALAVAGGKRFG
jgi:hypothetical protein